MNYYDQSGVLITPTKPNCTTCDGWGSFRVVTPGNVQIVPCSTCHGTGKQPAEIDACAVPQTYPKQLPIGE